LGPDPHSSKKLDPYPHSPKMLDPDLHAVNADPKNYLCPIFALFFLTGTVIYWFCVFKK
jgi:hypothetical protein